MSCMRGWLAATPVNASPLSLVARPRTWRRAILLARAHAVLLGVRTSPLLRPWRSRNSALPRRRPSSSDFGGLSTQDSRACAWQLQAMHWPPPCHTQPKTTLPLSSERRACAFSRLLPQRASAVRRLRMLARRRSHAARRRTRRMRRGRQPRRLHRGLLRRSLAFPAPRDFSESTTPLTTSLPPAAAARRQRCRRSRSRHSPAVLQLPLRCPPPRLQQRLRLPRPQPPTAARSRPRHSL